MDRRSYGGPFPRHGINAEFAESFCARPAMSTQDMTIDEAKAGWGDLLSGKSAIYALALAGGVMLHAVNIYIVATMLPSVVRDIGGLDYYAWSTTLFVAASILGSALSARLLRGMGTARSVWCRGAHVRRRNARVRGRSDHAGPVGRPPRARFRRRVPLCPGLFGDPDCPA